MTTGTFSTVGFSFGSCICVFRTIGQIAHVNTPMSENLSTKNKQLLEELFDKLDINKDGRVDISELLNAFDFGGKSEKNQEHAAHIIHKGTEGKESALTFSDFLHYVLENQKKLYITFQNIDKDSNGLIDPTELVTYFKRLGFTLKISDAEKLCKKISHKKCLRISWDEWRDFFTFVSNGNNIHDVLEYWKYFTFLDLAESNVVPDEWLSGDWWKDLVSGAVAGITSRTATAPLDRLKTVIQYMASRRDITLVGGFRYLVEEGGIKSLWRGNFLNCLKVAPESAFKFMFYEKFKRRIRIINNKPENADLAIYERFIAGSCAGAVSQSIIYPIDVVKTRIILSRTGEFQTITHCISKMLRQEGISCFYKGYLPNVIGIIPYAGIDLAIYETLKRKYIMKCSQEPSTVVMLACGAASTFTAQIFTYPLALVRTRLQAQVALPGDRNYHTMSTLFQETWRKQGIRGLYKGLMLNALKVIPAVSISYATYETVKRYLTVQDL